MFAYTKKPDIFSISSFHVETVVLLSPLELAEVVEV